MSVRFIRLALAATLVSTGACVYYNGMYNANRLARSARKAEREGRTFQANGLWGQVATKAESVVVRHPTSKYAAEADILRGVALARMGQCDQALEPLSKLSSANISVDLQEDALLSTGRCQIAAGNIEAADAAFLQLLDSKSADHRREARYQHARVLRQSGQFAEALKALPQASDPRINTERFLALAGAGQLSTAMALADSLLAQSDSTKHWDSLVVMLGEENPRAASALVDRVRKLHGRSRDAEVRLLLEDGMRLASVDTARATQRLREVMATDSTGNAAVQAGLALVRLDLKRVSKPEELDRVLAALDALTRRPGMGLDEVSQLSASLREVRLAGVAITPDTAQGDIRLFLAAESARDSLNAPLLAQMMFRRLPEVFPVSPYAPKAILAAQRLSSAWQDSARTLLQERYADSPYLAVVRGEATDEYRRLEDSLAGFAAAQASHRPAGVRRRAAVPEIEDHLPSKRPPTSKVPEPQ